MPALWSKAFPADQLWSRLPELPNPFPMCPPNRGAARKIARALSRRRRDQIFPEHADERQISIPLHVIEAVADHEFVRDLEPDVIGVDTAQARFLFFQQHADAHALRADAFDLLSDRREGDAA